MYIPVKKTWVYSTATKVPMNMSKMPNIDSILPFLFKVMNQKFGPLRVGTAMSLFVISDSSFLRNMDANIVTESPRSRSQKRCIKKYNNSEVEIPCI